MHSHDHYTRLALAAIGRQRPISQRTLARELGIALGLTNELVRGLVRRGWVRSHAAQRDGNGYEVTLAGRAAEARLARKHLASSVRFYTEMRDRVRLRLAAVSRSIAKPAGEKTVVFFGADAVAELGFLTVQETDLRLVGVIDGERSQPFFGVPVYSPGALQRAQLDGQPFDGLVVMRFSAQPAISAHLRRCHVPRASVFWL